MKIYWKIIFLILVCANITIGQADSKRTLLEATVTGAGMVQLEGKHLYVRLYSNGEIEYKDQIIKNDMPKYVMRRTKLSKSQLQEVKEFLQSSNVETLETSYPALNPVFDHVLELSISIMDKKLSKTIIIKNFSPTSPKASKTYPVSLIELVCRIEHLRKDSSISITADTNEWCKL